MPSGEGEDGKQSESLLDQIRRWRTDADKGREPELLSARLGSRQYSISALIERIIDAFADEHSTGSDALNAANTEAERLKLILATVEYVLAVESIQMSSEDKAALIRRVYNELFTYGPLDALFADESITTITIEGANKIAVRHSHADLETLEPIFEDEAHLRKIVGRLLRDSGTQSQSDKPIIEIGLKVNGKPINLNIASPPATIQLNVDIRLHPAVPPTLADLETQWSLSEETVELLSALTRSEHGMAIIGEAESGKTTLLNALLSLLPESQQEGLVVIENSQVLHPPKAAHRSHTQTDNDGAEPHAFATNIDSAFALENVTVMVIDEVRADEAEAIGRLLSEAHVPRQIWALGGPTSGKRLLSALGMLARRSGGGPNASEDRVRALFERIPFTITVRRHQGKIEIFSMSEWQFSDDSDYPNYVELMTMGSAGLELSGRQSQRPLDLPKAFWSATSE